MMPSCSATRRASSTSATEQQPESDSPPQSLRVVPTTSWPCSTSSAAATEESTPPDMATMTRTGPVCHRRSDRLTSANGSGGAQSTRRCRHDGERPVDVVLRGVVSERETNGTSRPCGRDAHGGEDVTWLEGTAGARRAAGRADSPAGESDQQLLPIDPGQADVQV